MNLKKRDIKFQANWRWKYLVLLRKSFSFDSLVVNIKSNNRHGRRAANNADCGSIVNAQQGQLITRGRHWLGHEYKKHSDTEQSGYADAYFLCAPGRQVEAEKSDQSDEKARKDHVEQVEQGTSSYDQTIEYLRIRFLTARILFQVFGGYEIS